METEGVPKAMAMLIRKCLKKSRSERYADAAELGTALRELLATES
jgi:hypothetical protein